MSRTARCPSVPKVQVDQRSREARLRLEQVERLLTRGPRRLENWFTQGLFCSSIRPQMGRAGPRRFQDRPFSERSGVRSRLSCSGRLDQLIVAVCAMVDEVSR